VVVRVEWASPRERWGGGSALRGGVGSSLRSRAANTAADAAQQQQQPQKTDPGDALLPPPLVGKRLCFPGWA